MSLRPEELLAVGAELNRALQGAVVHRITAPTTTDVYLEFRLAGQSTTLRACSEPGRARVSVVDGMSGGPWTPWEAVLRAELSGARLARIEATVDRGLVTLDFTRALRSVQLALECTETPTVVLVGDGGRVRALSTPSRPGLEVGQPWARPSARPLTPAPQRLSGGAGPFPLGRAAERLFEKSEG